MLMFFKQCGMFGPPILIILLTNIVLFVVNALRISGARREDAARIQNGVNAILFWGVLSALLGFLGQYSGLYNSLNVISRASEISPRLVAQGFAESFSTTIFGMVILVLSALAWLILQGWYRRVSRAWVGAATQ